MEGQMEYFEGEGRTLEEALQGICETHGVAREDLDYLVLDHKKKLLGFLGRDTIQVKAWLKCSGGLGRLGEDMRVSWLGMRGRGCQR